MKYGTKGFPIPFLFALLMVLASVGPAAAQSCAWSYEGATGPAHWGEICAPSNLVCVAGTRQSPIDVPAAPNAKLPKLVFDYRPTPLEVENNGHTIEVKVQSESYLRIGRESYRLVQFHFHTPSEHRLKGEAFPMELHFVHRNALGELAVVGVFLREGASNPALQRIWDHIPGEAEVAAAHGEKLDPEDLLPQDREYYRYAGSLTTPPCSEGVRWHVLREPVDVSGSQVDEFRAIFPLNARPLQLLNDRPVLTEH
jgi:carbonic anhydrase